MNKKTLFLVVLGTLVLPVVTMAAGVTIESMLIAAVKTAWQLAFGITIICWIITGILFLVAQGDPSKVSLAKKALLASIVGIGICILAFSAVKLVGSSLGIPT